MIAHIVVEIRYAAQLVSRVVPRSQYGVGD
jgi:hypothetical protein